MHLQGNDRSTLHLCDRCRRTLRGCIIVESEPHAQYIRADECLTRVRGKWKGRNIKVSLNQISRDAPDRSPIE